MLDIRLRGGPAIPDRKQVRKLEVNGELGVILPTDKAIRIEAARGFAAAYVFLGHALVGGALARSSIFSYPFRFGQEAVMLFFVISGFVIELSFQKSKPKSFPSYFARRFTRIYPIFVLALLVTWLFGSGIGNDRSLPVLLGNLLMIQDLDWAKPGVAVPVFGNNQALWSLSYEWWFYMAFYPIRTLIAERFQLLSVAFISATGLLATIVAPCQAGYFSLYFPVWWLGVELYRFRRGTASAAKMTASIGLVLFLAFAMFLFAEESNPGKELDFGYFPGLLVRHHLAGVGVVLVALLWKNVKWCGYWSLLRPFAVVAPFSYALYVFHFPLVKHWKGGDVTPSVWKGVALGAVVAVVLAIAAEGPFQRWARSCIGRR